MKILGILLLLVGLGALALFLWPVLDPEARPTNEARPPAKQYRRARIVAKAAAPAPKAEVEAGSVAAARSAASHGTDVHARKGPLCDTAFEASKARRVRVPKGAEIEGFAGRAGAEIGKDGKKGWRWVNLWAAW